MNALPHGLPPHEGWLQPRAATCEPLPHDLVQAAQALQVWYVPSSGQHCELQRAVWDRPGQALPPCWGATHVRVRVWVPVPHVREQALKADQPLTTASTGQACVLQLCELDRVGQALPPCWGLVQLRERDCEPVPQVLEQPPQPPQAPTTAWMGQALGLHARVSRRFDGHAAPKSAVGARRRRRLRYRFWKPPSESSPFW